MLSKKAIGPVIATSLLIVVAVASIVGFQGWFNSFESSTFTDIEQKNSDETSISIEGVVGNNLYLKKNSNKNNLSIIDVKMNGNSCSISGNYSSKINELDLSSCDAYKTAGKNEITVVSNNKVINNYFFSEGKEFTYYGDFFEEVPVGAIIAFNQSSCPSGWQRFSAGDQRMLLGAGSGNKDKFGNVLTARTLGQTGGLEYTTGIPATLSIATAPGIASVFSGTRVFATGTVSGSGYGSPTNLVFLQGGNTTDSNVPPVL